MKRCRPRSQGFVAHLFGPVEHAKVVVIYGKTVVLSWFYHVLYGFNMFQSHPTMLELGMVYDIALLALHIYSKPSPIVE